MGPDGANLGVMRTWDAVQKAREIGLDLIEVSAKAVPPVAKIMDYGKFTYEQKKKQRDVRAHAFVAETKSVQVKIGTGERDKELKAERIDEWLTDGHRVKVDLFLWGRYKYMEAAFLTERLYRFLEMVQVPYKIAEPVQRSPKGYGCVIERDKAKPLPTAEELQRARAASKKARAQAGGGANEEDRQSTGAETETHHNTETTA